MSKVMVSMPARGARRTLAGAVDAVLGQTHTDFTLAVIQDGTDDDSLSAIEDVRDPRLTRLVVPQRHGRFFADRVTLLACQPGYAWWTAHDADDAAYPNWLARMIEVAEDSDLPPVDMVMPAHNVITPGRPNRIWSPPTGDFRFAPDMLRHRNAIKGGRDIKHWAFMHSLWDVAWLRRCGGPDPSYLIGYDTVLSFLAFKFGSVATIDEPLYDRYVRPGSLTNHPATGFKSRLRMQVRARVFNDTATPPGYTLDAFRAGMWANHTDLMNESLALARVLRGMLNEDLESDGPEPNEPVDSHGKRVRRSVGSRPRRSRRTGLPAQGPEPEIGTGVGVGSIDGDPERLRAGDGGDSDDPGTQPAIPRADPETALVSDGWRRPAARSTGKRKTAKPKPVSPHVQPGGNRESDQV